MSQVQRKALAVEGQLRAARDLRIIEAYRAGRREAFDELVASYEGTGPPSARRL